MLCKDEANLRLNELKGVKVEDDRGGRNNVRGAWARFHANGRPALIISAAAVN
jgi:hypothetical protein